MKKEEDGKDGREDYELAILLIEGDPGAIDHLLGELVDRNYLGDAEYNYATKEAPGFSSLDKWSEFLCGFEHFLEYFE